jgi:transcriptional regulator with XRE-family HTH domain
MPVQDEMQRVIDALRKLIPEGVMAERSRQIKRDKSYVSQVFRGATPLRLVDLFRLLELVGVSPETFFVEHVYSLRKDVEPVMHDYARTGGRFGERLDALESRVSELEGK